MSSTTTQLTIANRALQLVGAPSISSLQQPDKGAREVNRCYQSVMLEELRNNLWSFSIKRIIIAASTTPPAFGMANYFQLPGDFVKLAPPDPQYNFSYIDWQIEGTQIASNMTGPLYVRYVSSNVTEGEFDPSFAEAFAARIAINICEPLTQSSGKLQALGVVYKDAIDSARRNNAFENRPVKAPVDTWITKRF